MKGTIIEKQIPTLTFYDGFQMTSLTDCLDFGTVKVQENEVLIKKSKLPGVGKMPGNIPAETGKIDFVDSGQIHTPDSINTDGAPLPEPKDDIKINGYYYNNNGLFEGHVFGQKIGKENDVYACEGKGTENNIFLKPKN